MRILIDAISARSGGALTDYLGILTAIEKTIERPEDIVVLANSGLIESVKPLKTRLNLVCQDVGPGTARALWLYNGLKSALREFRSDVLLAGQFVPDGLDIPYVLRLTEPALVDPAYEPCIRFLPTNERVHLVVKKFLLRRSLRNAQAVICATRTAADCLLRFENSLQADRVVVSPFGLSPVVAGVKTRHIFRRTYKLLTMHVAPHKNIELIIRALALPEMSKYTLSIMADLNNPVTKYERYLAAMVRVLNLERRVISLGFQKHKEDVVRHLLDHDALVVPSVTETWSHGLIEGMALGMPVIASDIPCHREVSGGAAWTTPVNDPEALAEKVALIEAQGPEVRERIEKGLELTSKLSWGCHVAVIIDSLRRAFA